jgi:hypothetical protein
MSESWRLEGCTRLDAGRMLESYNSTSTILEGKPLMETPPSATTHAVGWRSRGLRTNNNHIILVSKLAIICLHFHLVSRYGAIVLANLKRASKASIAATNSS